MKRGKLLAASLLAVLPTLTWAVAAQAHSFHSGGSVTIAKDQTVSKTLFAAGHSVDIAGKVDGDVFCAAQNVTITGSVTGDVICAGQTVRIAGKVDGDVRVVGQSVTIGGQVRHNLTAAGQSVTTETGSTVGGDASIGGQSASLNGSIGRDAAIGSQSTTVDGLVGRDVQASGENLTFGSTASIHGNVEYTSNNTLTQNNGAHVLGTITHHIPTRHTRPARHVGSVVHVGVWFALYMFVSLLIVALVLVLLVPRAFHMATEVAVRHPWKTLLTGLVSSIVMPVVLVLLAVTVVGIPLAILLLLSWLVVGFLAGPFAAYYIGRLLMQKSTNAVLIMMLGAVLLLMLYIIPFVGGIVWLFAGWFGLGIILLQVPHLPRPRNDVALASEGGRKNKHQRAED